MMPPILLGVYVVLIVWPSLKLAATIIARPKWAQQRRLKAEILSRDTITSAERELVEAEFNDGRGTPLQLILPPVALFGGIAAALAHGAFSVEQVDELELTERIYQAQVGEAPNANVRSLMRDDKFRTLQQEAFELSMLRYPVCSIATGVALVPSVILFVIFTGFKASWRTFITAATSGSRQALRAFEHSFEGVYRGC